MAVEVQSWKSDEAHVLFQASAEFKQRARDLEEIMQQLNQINATIFSSQVSGPPGEYLNKLWGEWESNSKPLIGRLQQLGNQLHYTASDWQQDYQSQKAAAEAEAAQASSKAVD